MCARLDHVNKTPPRHLHCYVILHMRSHKGEYPVESAIVIFQCNDNPYQDSMYSYINCALEAFCRHNNDYNLYKISAYLAST